MITAILAVVYPEKYGVLNTKSETALRKLTLWPELQSADFADTYAEVNKILNDLADRNRLSLLRLDRVLGELAVDPLAEEEQEDREDGEPAVEPVDSSRYVLERQLEMFLVENWDETPLGERFKLLEDDGETVGQQYAMDPIGRADLVGREKGTGAWVVIELKGGRVSDRVVGQLARYMGWVKRNMAEPHESVRGVIVAGDADDSIRYALSAMPNVELYTYTVDFRFRRTEVS